MSDALEWDALFAIYPEEHGIDEECHEEVHQYTAHHHEKTLPSRLVLEKFVGRNVGFFLCHCIGIGAFVHHAGDIYVSTEGKPANDKVCVAPTAKFQCFLLTAFPEIKEEAEAMYANAKHFGKEKVPAFVQYHENRDTQDELKGFNKEYFHEKNRLLLRLNC